MLGHVKTQKKTITFNAFICFIVIAATIFRFVLLWYFSWDVRNWPHDDLLQRNNAISILNGNWLGDYSNVTLPKYPGFPLFLAFINRLFIPYSIGIGLIMTLSSFSFCMAISPLVKKKCDGKTEGGSDKLQTLFLAGLYLGILYVPIPYMAMSRIYRNVLAPWLVLLIFSGICGMYTRTDRLIKILPWSMITACSLALFSILREDYIWIYIPVFVAGGVIFSCQLKNSRNVLRTIILLIMIAFPIVFAVGVQKTIALINYHIYGVQLLSDRTEGYFAEMMGKLYSIRPVEEEPDSLWVSRKSINRAQESSPTLAKLDIEEAINMWTGSNTREMYGDMISWAIRDAISAKGYFKDAQNTQSFLRSICNELKESFKNDYLSEREGFQISSSMRNVTFNEVFDVMWFALKNDLCFLRYPQCTVDISKMFVDDPHDIREEVVLEWEKLLNIKLPRSDVQLDTIAAGESIREENAIRKRYIRYSAKIQNSILLFYQALSIPIIILAVIGFMFQTYQWIIYHKRHIKETKNGKILLIIVALFLSIILESITILLFSRFMVGDVVGASWSAYYLSSIYPLQLICELLGIYLLAETVLGIASKRKFFCF